MRETKPSSIDQESDLPLRSVYASALAGCRVWQGQVWAAPRAALGAQGFFWGTYPLSQECLLPSAADRAAPRPKLLKILGFLLEFWLLGMLSQCCCAGSAGVHSVWNTWDFWVLQHHFFENPRAQNCCSWDFPSSCARLCCWNLSALGTGAFLGCSCQAQPFLHGFPNPFRLWDFWRISWKSTAEKTPLKTDSKLSFYLMLPSWAETFPRRISKITYLLLPYCYYLNLLFICC